ncbi:MAG: DUF2619 domain-containing protein [Tepidanaerobacteraceae bacterium]
MNPIIVSMAAIRFISAFLEFFAAILFLKMNSVEYAVRLNAVLAIAGPFVFLTVSLIGISGISIKVSLTKMVILIIGIALILVGTQLD